MSRTHDTSFIEYHIKDIEELGADLNEAVQAAWPKRHSIRYSRVRVLLLSWQADDLGVEAEIEPLRRVLEDRYHFEVQDYRIPSIKPDKALKKRVFDFLEEEDNDTLLIVYYAGHARGALQSNEASLWFASRTEPQIVVPSGGIQSMLEEADADVILLCDCCHSTAIPTTDSHQRSNKVMEAITACGYEAVAAEVGHHSFTKALTDTLAIASKGLPFTISELHARIVSRLKCWVPELLKGKDGNYVDTAQNRLLYEQQPRRTPIFTVVCRATQTRSILLAPLGTLYPSPSDSGEETYQHSSGKSKANMNIDEGEGPSNEGTSEHLSKKRKKSFHDGGRYPYVLLSARLERRYEKQAWLEWVRNAPVDVKDIHIEGAFASFSTLLLVRMPVAVWNLLQSNLAYTFLGYVTSGNYAVSEGCICTGTVTCETCGLATGFPMGEDNTAMSAEVAESSQIRSSEELFGSEDRSEISSVDSIFTLSSNTGSIWGKNPVATSVRTSSRLRGGLLAKSLTALFEPGTLQPSSTTPYALQPSTKPLSASSAKATTTSSQTASSLADLSIDGAISSESSKTRNNHGRSSSHSHHPGQSHRQGHGTSSRATAEDWHWEWFWSCCQCGYNSMSTFSETCPNNCGHYRCDDCPMEAQKIRNGA